MRSRQDGAGRGAAQAAARVDAARPINVRCKTAPIWPPRRREGQRVEKGRASGFELRWWDQGNSAKTELPDEAKAKLDEMITKIKADPKAAWYEIEGHTDNVGPVAANERLGLERAEAVKRYLYEQHQIPLHKMNVISYGEEKPVAPNKTRADRAQNRRVVIKILA